VSEKRASAVQAVLFDAGNTLGMPDWPRIIAVVERTAGRTFEAARLQRDLIRILSDADSDEEFLKELSARAVGFGWHFRALFARLGLTDPELEILLAALATEHAERHLWARLNPEAAPVLSALHAAGLRLGVISNSEDGQIDLLLGAMGIAGYFELALDSYLFGTAKPDPRIFRHAVAELDVDPAAAVYVGDMYTQDVLGAERAGLRGVLYDPLDLHRDRGVARIRSLGELLEL
jgi:HAD superfamily hydrolase (TIGR01509 family)